MMDWVEIGAVLGSLIGLMIVVYAFVMYTTR